MSRLDKTENERLFRYSRNFEGTVISKGSFLNMSTTNSNSPILELRVALTTNDYERLGQVLL
jgi:hypothetical protein